MYSKSRKSSMQIVNFTTIPFLVLGWTTTAGTKKVGIVVGHIRYAATLSAQNF